jgi:hypothetical protein
VENNICEAADQCDQMTSAEEGTADSDAFEETLIFLKYFEDLPDTRQQGKIQ